MAFDLQQKVFRLPESIALSVGLQWDFVGADPVDLDLSALCFTSEGMFVDCVFFNHQFPEGTDVEALRTSGLIVDVQQLPYMFVGGDSRIGGEEENQMPGLELFARRREYQLRNTGGSKSNILKRAGITDAIFSRLYEAAELEMVEKTLDDEHKASNWIRHREFCDETVTFVMHKIPSDVDVIFIVVTSYTGADFTTLPGVKLVVVNETANEQVGVIDLKRSTGNGTANLACMLCRLQTVTPEISRQQLWDLRELNIRSFGYTFVDMIPAIMDVIGIDEASRDDAVRLLPNYSLMKEPFHNMYNNNNNGSMLLDVRFGVGWDGEHDIDAFMVIMDENNRYVDHIHPKQAKLRSVYPHAASHSGDAINGFGTVGDEEFIDFITYRMPPEAHTILFGAVYVETFGKSAASVKSIFDVPKLYLRLQNRTAERPNSFEVDRWDIYREVEKEKANSDKKKNSKRESISLEEPQHESTVCRTYVGVDGKTHFVYMVLLGAMVKKGEVPLINIYSGSSPEEQRQLFQNEMEFDVSGVDNVMAPIFGYSSLRECIPVRKEDSFAAAMPYLHGVVRYRCDTVSSKRPATRPQRTILYDVDNAVDCSTHTSHAVPVSLLSETRALQTITSLHALRVQFLEVRGLRLTLPHRFRCHGQAWVCRGETSSKGEMQLFETPPFRTPYLIHRDKTVWDERSPATWTVFFVRLFDRIRVVIYEYAAFGSVDIDLTQLEELWAEAEQPSYNGRKMVFRGIKRWFPLSCSGSPSGEVCLRISRLPLKQALNSHKKKAEKCNKQWKQAVMQKNKLKDENVRKQYSFQCSVM